MHVNNITVAFGTGTTMAGEFMETGRTTQTVLVCYKLLHQEGSTINLSLQLAHSQWQIYIAAAASHVHSHCFRLNNCIAFHAEFLLKFEHWLVV